MSSSGQNKTCPNCGKIDHTDFSTCRFCSTRYDAHIAPKKIDFDLKAIVLAVALTFLVVFAFDKVVGGAVRSSKARETARSEIAKTGWPRVLEFYADWCGPCRAYGPIVEECSARYKGRVDFERYNVDSQLGRSLAQSYEVSGIPRTIVFNAAGTRVADMTGSQSMESLEEAIRDSMH